MKTPSITKSLYQELGKVPTKVAPPTDFWDDINRVLRVYSIPAVGRGVTPGSVQAAIALAASSTFRSRITPTALLAFDSACQDIRELFQRQAPTRNSRIGRVLANNFVGAF